MTGSIPHEYFILGWECHASTKPSLDNLHARRGPTLEDPLFHQLELRGGRDKPGHEAHHRARHFDLSGIGSNRRQRYQPTASSR